MARKRKNGPSDTNNLFSLRCECCGRCLIRTSGRYLSCPEGHGRLIEAEVDDEPYYGEPCGSLFEPDHLED